MLLGPLVRFAALGGVLRGRFDAECAHAPPSQPPFGEIKLKLEAHGRVHAARNPDLSRAGRGVLRAVSSADGIAGLIVMALLWVLVLPRMGCCADLKATLRVRLRGHQHRDCDAALSREIRGSAVSGLAAASRLRWSNTPDQKLCRIGRPAQRTSSSYLHLQHTDLHCVRSPHGLVTLPVTVRLGLVIAWSPTEGILGQITGEDTIWALDFLPGSSCCRTAARCAIVNPARMVGMMKGLQKCSNE
ncbi:hypothetical protein FA95DRAFT_408446 [Auriscalpium vulgare]|uniref:Uncharacterized protein n=1 Tax=Auriscalpium vulgare TaxID=40419 RepID=A0ACB8RHF3_9AGAM|nr:hypothetical protein FA95DRAFT_408446 [Auriscalpium vulgare]